MSSFDWLEFENLTNDIELLHDQLIEARFRKAIARVRTLEEEIARSEERRTRLLAHLTVNMISDAETRMHPRSHRPVGLVPEPTGGEHRAAAVAQAGCVAECPNAVVNEISVTRTPTPTPYGARLEEGILVPKQLAPDEENSSQLATLESLTRDIDVSRVRLAVAKLRKDPDLARRLEKKSPSRRRGANASWQRQHSRSPPQCKPNITRIRSNTLTPNTLPAKTKRGS